jgi:chromosome segregation ATPase
MALVGLSEAARITGRNRTTIFRAMKSGRLSFTTNGAGERQVDVAELERVFAATDAEQPQSDATHVAVLNAQLDAERRQNALLERTCEDLRRRLDEADAERRNVQTQLSAQLADRRDQSNRASDSSKPAIRRMLSWLVAQHR